jgi:general secretion pathway protein E
MKQVIDASQVVAAVNSTTPAVPRVRTYLVEEFLKRLREPPATGSPAPAGNTPELAPLLVQAAYEARASDLHLDPQEIGLRVRFRIDGVICDVAYLTTEQGRTLINQFKALAELDPITRFTPRDAHASVPLRDQVVNLRLALAPCSGGEKLAVRLMDQRRIIRSIEALGLAKEKLRTIQDWLESSSGLFLAAGPTGCGKTTTVYALLHELRLTDQAIITLEEPIEYRIDGITQIQIDELHHLSYPEGVRAMLRLDPDYLMLGELRDGASGHAAVNAAMSGRILLSTIHCRDAVGAVTTLRNWNLPDPEIAESLVVVIAQRLVRRLCPHCRREGKPQESELRWLKLCQMPIPKQVWQSHGCPQCHQLGYLGRIGVFELWRLDEQDYRGVLEHLDEHSIRQHLSDRGHTSLLEDGLAKVTDGITTLSELRRMGTSSFASPQIPPTPSPIPGIARP